MGVNHGCSPAASAATGTSLSSSSLTSSLSSTSSSSSWRDDANCNVVVVGDSRVGKTALLNRVVHDRFSPSYAKTPTLSPKNKVCWNMDVAGRRIRFTVWDTSGSRLSSASSTGNSRLYRHADVFLLCYKISEPATLVSALNIWRKEIVAQARADTSIVLVGLQADLRHDHEAISSLARCGVSPVTADHALSLSQENGCDMYVETSAKNQDRSAFSAFEVAALISTGKIGGVARNASVHSSFFPSPVVPSEALGVAVPPPIPPKPRLASPPVPPKPRRAVSQLLLEQESFSQFSPQFRGRSEARPQQVQSQSQLQLSRPPRDLSQGPLYTSSPKLSLKTAKQRKSSTSMLSLRMPSLANLTSTGSPTNTVRRAPRDHSLRRRQQKHEEKTVTIRCQRLNEAREYEEVEVEVPEKVYETLRFYNEQVSPVEASRCASRATSSSTSSSSTCRRSFASKIKDLIANRH